MNDEVPGIRWGVEQRLEFIEFRLFWEGGSVARTSSTCSVCRFRRRPRT